MIASLARSRRYLVKTPRASYKRTHDQNRLQVNIVNMGTRGLMIGLALLLGAIAVVAVLDQILEQRAEQPGETYTPPAVTGEYEK